VVLADKIVETFQVGPIFEIGDSFSMTRLVRVWSPFLPELRPCKHVTPTGHGGGHRRQADWTPSTINVEARSVDGSVLPRVCCCKQ
jgi:hypothetical protein